MTLPAEYIFQNPFGEVSCENELDVFQDHYPDFYYELSRFNEEALEPEIYLIVGRRGCGKTSLTKYFGFQSHIRNAHSIDVDEPTIYDSIISRIARKAYLSPDLIVNDVRKIWEYLIWSLIFYEYRAYDSCFERAGFFTGRLGKFSVFVRELLKQVLTKYVDETGSVADALTDMLSDPLFTRAKERALTFTRREPIIIAIDTFERYDRNNDAMMAVTAALIQAASKFNVAYAHRGIHIKAFVSAEIFPYIQESNIPNTTKFIRDPLYMLWKPKDLVRLIAWRFYKHLQETNHPLPFKDVNWDDFDDVRSKLWTPFFGDELRNLHNEPEQSLPYILRHTQMRPRQLVILSNRIARFARKAEKFPYFYKINIAQAVAESESILADEVLNSYGLIYPGVGEIVTALTSAPSIFKGNYIDQVARRTSRYWPDNSYTAMGFRRLVAELGIVGRARGFDEKKRIVEADFEYAMNDRLVLNDTDDCVIHPMFYTKLQIQRDRYYIIYPFPDHEDYHQVRISKR